MLRKISKELDLVFNLTKSPIFIDPDSFKFLKTKVDFQVEGVNEGVKFLIQRQSKFPQQVKFEINTNFK